jgi:DNA-binding MurR/RpiR family transcriptional regulator
LESPIGNLFAEHFEGMPPQMKVAARWIADHPTDVALLSMREQARRARVALPTLSRLALRLGFSGFEALKSVHAGHVREQNASFRGLAVNLLRTRRGQKDDEFIAGHMAALAGHVGALTTPEAVNSLKRAADSIAHAEKVFCLGLRSSFPPAFMFHYIRSLFGADSVLIDGAGGTGVDALRTIAPRDILLAVSVSPYTRQTLDAANFAAGRKVKIVALTDSTLSPIAQLANLSVIVATQTPSFFHTMTPAVAAIECIAALVARRRGEKGLTAIARSEQQLAAFDTYFVSSTNRVKRLKRVHGSNNS